jgi:hypothetical protein
MAFGAVVRMPSTLWGLGPANLCPPVKMPVPVDAV